jgi:hypothetical protein
VHASENTVVESCRSGARERMLVLHSSKRVDKTASELPMGTRGSSPDPGLGASIKLPRGEVGGRLDLPVIGKALARKGIAAK